MCTFENMVEDWSNLDSSQCEVCETQNDNIKAIVMRHRKSPSAGRYVEQVNKKGNNNQQQQKLGSSEKDAFSAWASGKGSKVAAPSNVQN